MAPACGRHNRAVGSEPHQWATEKITDGPDKGRYGWRRITDPPEKLRANHLHRIDELLLRHRDTLEGSVAPPAPTSDDIAEPSTDATPERRSFDVTWPRGLVTYAA